MSEEIRADLVALVQAVGAYVEHHSSCGTVGFPKGAKVGREVQHAASQAPEPLHAPPVAHAHEQHGPEPAQAEPPSAANPGPASQASAEREREFAAPTFDAPDFDAPRKKAAKVEPPAPKRTLEERSARLPLLQQEVASCSKCGLSETRNNTVFARGNPEAALCFIGEAPGADEDAQGLPFVDAPASCSTR